MSNKLYSNERVIIKGPQECYGCHNIDYQEIEEPEIELPGEWLMWDYDPFEPLLRYDILATKVFT